MPKGRTYVISDVHGCYREFETLLGIVSPTSDDRLYVLGDAIDRGPGSAEMARWLLNAPENVTYMLGNHELMMLEDVRDPADMALRMDSNWGYNGGFATADEMLGRLTADERAAYFELCRGLSPVMSVRYPDRRHGGRITDSVLVHAGFYVDRGLLESTQSFEDFVSKQTVTDMVWERDTWLLSGWDPPFPVVFGHTPVQFLRRYFADMEGAWFRRSCGDSDPTAAMLDRSEENRVVRWGNHIDIDCGCAYDGHLACLRLDDRHVFYEDALEEDLPDA